MEYLVFFIVRGMKVRRFTSIMTQAMKNEFAERASRIEPNKVVRNNS